jgi:hypothetical protein
MGNKYKYLDKQVLNNINHISRDVIKYNRALPQDIIDALPDDKLFPISWCMVHEHIAGRAVEPHMRCLITVPAGTGSRSHRGRETLLLDIEMGLFNLLPEVELPDVPTEQSTV